VLVAIGQCAIMGGLPAMRNAIMHSDDPLRECLEEAYITGRYLRNTTHNPQRPGAAAAAGQGLSLPRSGEDRLHLIPAARRGDAIWDTLTKLLGRQIRRLRTEADPVRLRQTRPTMAEPRLIEISPVTRVEGHGKVTLHLDDAGRSQQARLHIVEFRGFERFIQGRPFWELPVIVQRLCGICPVSHHLAAAKAMDQIVGVDSCRRRRRRCAG
jgi:hypothetical protein